MNVSPSTIFDIKRRAWQYWFVDGLTHLLLGIALLSLSICILHPPRPQAYGQLALWAALLLLYVGLLLGQRQIVEWLKTKITYPRTGYVQPPFDAEQIAGPRGIVELRLDAEGERRGEARRLAAAQRKQLLLAAALAIAASLTMLLIESRWVYTAVGVLFALAIWALRKHEKVSWITVAGLPTLGVYMTMFLAPNSYPPHRLAWFMAGWGGLFVLEGTIGLARYLLRNPKTKAVEP